MLTLYPHQSKLETDIYDAWASGAQNVMTVLSTGGGKTVIFSDILHKHQGASAVVVHRKELVSQISLALAKFGVVHRIIAPGLTINWIIGLHIQEFGRSFYNKNAPCGVIGVDTLLNRVDQERVWLGQVTRWVVDEAHHLLVKNKWGKAVKLFTHPDVKGLGVTATAIRADGKGLGRHADGVFDTIVEGPPMRWLIDNDFLCDYRIICPPSDLNIEGVELGSNGDFKKGQLAARVDKSSIVGDVVHHYLKFAPGKQGLVFANSVETATKIALQFREAGVKAEVIHGGTPTKLRVDLIKRFKNKDLQQLVNCDLFGEGLDIPGIEVISFARTTASLGLYMQQFGRGLRWLLGKGKAVIIDHVGNVVRHGLPDKRRFWTLNRRDKRAKKKVDDGIPMTTCTNPACLAPYERIHKQCPFCGHINIPAQRSAPEFVDGDLVELSPEALAEMRGEIARVDAPDNELHWPVNRAAANNAITHHRARQAAQTALRDSMSWWFGHHAGMSVSEMQRRFYFGFGIDVGSAQTLNTKDAGKLTIEVNKAIDTLVKTG